MLPHVVPYDRDRVLADQPWLTYRENEQLQDIFDQIQFSLNRLVSSPMQYILTEDGRIVEEPNFARWTVFMERAGLFGDNYSSPLTTIRIPFQEPEVWGPFCGA